MSQDIFRVGKTDRPTCDLNEGEVKIVIGALKAKADRLRQAATRLLDRAYPQRSAAYAVNLKVDKCVKLYQRLEGSENSWSLRNRDEVNLGAEAVSDQYVAIIRGGDRSDVRADVIRDLLHRIQVGWKRVPAVPPEILAQINQREDRRFWAPLGQVTEDVYAWREVETELPYVWVSAS